MCPASTCWPRSTTCARRRPVATPLPCPPTGPCSAWCLALLPHRPLATAAVPTLAHTHAPPPHPTPPPPFSRTPPTPTHHPTCLPPPLQVMREYGFLVRVCTAREATNFGIFLNEVFAMVELWRVSCAARGLGFGCSFWREGLGEESPVFGVRDGSATTSCGVSVCWREGAALRPRHSALGAGPASECVRGRAARAPADAGVRRRPPAVDSCASQSLRAATQVCGSSPSASPASPAERRRLCPRVRHSADLQGAQ